MDYQKNIGEIVQEITDESALKIIYDFITVPYNRAKLENKGSGQHGLQENDF